MMRAAAGLILVVVVVVGTSFGFIYYSNFTQSSSKDDDDKLLTEEDEFETIYSDTFEINEVNITWLGFSGIKLNYDGIIVYIDPFDIHDSTNQILERADYIITTHDHPDHHSHQDISKVSTENTMLLSSQDCSLQNITHRKVDIGEKAKFGAVSFEFVPMYTRSKINQFTHEEYHPLDQNSTGVIVDFGVLRLYHTGDSDEITEMKSINANIVFHPVMGKAYMSYQDAATAIEYIKLNSELQYSIPIHWGPESLPDHTQGTLTNVLNFISVAQCDVVVLEPQIPH